MILLCRHLEMIMGDGYPLQGEQLARHSHVRHGFFGRDHSADDILQYFSAAHWMCRGMCQVQQCHSSDVCYVGKEDDSSLWRCDGMVTCERGIVLAVRTADCIPLVLAADGCVAAIHVGWRGALDGIIESALACIKARGIAPHQCHGVMGPSIMAQSYEVGAEFEAMVDEQFLTPSPHDSTHFLFDLRGYVMTSLKSEGVQFLEEVAVDTYKTHSLFSHRRFCHDGKQGKTGTQLSAIGLV